MQGLVGGHLATVQCFISVSKWRFSFIRKGNIWSLSSSRSSTPANPPNPSPAAPSSPSSALPRKMTKRSGVLSCGHHTLLGVSSAAWPLRSSKFSLAFIYAAGLPVMLSGSKKKMTDLMTVFFQLKCVSQICSPARTAPPNGTTADFKYRLYVSYSNRNVSARFIQPSVSFNLLHYWRLHNTFYLTLIIRGLIKKY